MKKLIKSNKFLYTSLLHSKQLLLKNKNLKLRQGNIMMLHTGRTGSTVLADLLNQHTQIQWDGEIYIEQDKYLNYFCADPLKFLEHKMLQFPSPYYGFEIKGSIHQHLEEFIHLNLETYLQKLEILNFNKFIFLLRKNHLRRYISVLQIKHGRQLHTTKDENKPIKVFIDTERCTLNKCNAPILETFKILDENIENISQTLKKYDALKLVYEDDILVDPELAYKKVCDFLNIDDEKPVIHLKRTNPFTLNQMIENYEDVRELLINSKYHWMLEE